MPAASVRHAFPFSALAAACLLACAPLQPPPTAGDTTVCLLRHAETARGADGQYVEAFTDLGEAQVAALPAKLDAIAPRFDAILVSPAWRAMHTALPYLRDRKQAAEILPELMESALEMESAKLVAAANDHLRQRFSGKPVTVLLVGHSLTGSRLLQALQGQDTSDFDPKSPPYRLRNGAVSCLVQAAGQPDFRLVRLNDDAAVP